MSDPKGTCHLVGCVGKGKHLPTDPHSLPSDPPMSAMGIKQARQQIGAPDTWQPYEGGPTIPKPEYCLGFPKLEVHQTVTLVYCSIKSGEWNRRMERGCTYNVAALVDDHRNNCPNRAVR